ncbi:MAG: hypothetical protein CVU51_03945 [Deltaproteobacteria bacterium HGW-Deltaproteobacteria-1]|jgi:hypothetical protein|nr:MAG: hypothetical protein CVU51_03945 [Deltaproteobacteria bacterium HGW-Deltaproteobacteria-1]
MNKFIQNSTIILACCVVIVIIGLYTISTLFSGKCVNTISHEVLSPEGNYKAILFQTNCGVASSISTQVSIRPTGKNLKNDSGIIYIIDGHPKERHIKLIWLGPKKLLIRNPSTLQPFKSETHYKDIAIVYEQ